LDIIGTVTVYFHGNRLDSFTITCPLRLQVRRKNITKGSNLLITSCNYLGTRRLLPQNALFTPVFAIFLLRSYASKKIASTYTKMPISYLKIGAPKQLQNK